MNRTTQGRSETDLLTEALAALRELVLRTEDAVDHWVGDEDAIDTWKSDEFEAARRRAEAVLARAETTAAIEAAPSE